MPGAVHVDEQCRDAAMRRVRIAGARQEHATVGVVGEARPHLLPADPPAVSRPGRPALQCRQVASGSGLGEALTPGLVAAQQSRHHRGRQVTGRVIDHRRCEHLGHAVDARFDQPAQRQRFSEIRPQNARAAEAADAFGPPPPHPPGVERQPLHLGELCRVRYEGGRVAVIRCELVGMLIEPAVQTTAEFVEFHGGGLDPQAPAADFGTGRRGSCALPASRAPLRRRKVIDRVCRRQP